MAARAAALAEAELAERQGEVVGDDEHVVERCMLAGEDLADRDPRFVHVGERLGERQVKAVKPALDDGGGVARAAAPRPARPIGEPVEDHPAHVMARFAVLIARIAQADDDLHTLPRGTPTGPESLPAGPDGGLYRRSARDRPGHAPGTTERREPGCAEPS